MKKLLVSIIMMVLSVAICSAAEKGTSYFSRGLYIGLDFSTGQAINERVGCRGRNSCYGLDLAVGYRFLPQAVIAAGFGSIAYSNRTNTCNDTVYREIENTCIPVFVRFRSDFLNCRVSPYVQLDMGYAFMLLYARDDRGVVKHAEHPFVNGHNEYIQYRDSYLQYGMDGCFASLDLGLSWEVLGRFRMCFALSMGYHEAFMGTAYRMPDGNMLKFGITDKSADMILVGKPPMVEAMELDARVKIGFIF